MKFTYLALFCCALWTLVSALPLGLLGSESTPRDTDQRVEHRSLYARAQAIPYAVSLKRTDIGKPSEHWAYHFHPQADYKGKLHIVEAVSDATKKNKNPGVLQFQEKIKDEYNHPTTQKDGSELHHIANFATKTKALEAIRDIKNNVSLTDKFPDHNCVDFTCQAALHMAEKGHITEDEAKKVTDLHKEHEAAVRKKTDTEKNRTNAGVGA